MSEPARNHNVTTDRLEQGAMRCALMSVEETLIESSAGDKTSTGNLHTSPRRNIARWHLQSAPQRAPRRPIQFLRLPTPRCLLLLATMLVTAPVTAATLTLDLGHGVQRMTTQTLLARNDVRLIDIPADVAYGRTMHYRAVPLHALLEGIRAKDHLQVVALDGFTAEMSAGQALSTHGSQAWLAIQDPRSPWPPLGDGKPSAAPFYIVWTHPQADHISPEQWPYQVATIRRISALAARFPAMLPDASLPADAPARHGFTVFQSHCLACHTLNGEGDARLGPDLNIPHSPTEYLGKRFLRAYIRDPQSLRHWPQAKMQGFDRNTLSDSDLDDLIAYLRERAKHKKQP